MQQICGMQVIASPFIFDYMIMIIHNLPIRLPFLAARFEKVPLSYLFHKS